MHLTLICYFLFIFVQFVVLFFVFVQSVQFVVLFFVFVQSVQFVVSCHWCFVWTRSYIKNLDILINKIPEIRVKNTYCELACN